MTRACIGEVVFGKKRSNNNFLKFRTNLYSYIGNRLVGLSGQISKSEHSSNPSTTSMTATYSYDNNGNIVGDGLENVNFEYDLNNMVARVKNTLSGDTLTTYSYFADGEKVIVREGGVSTNNSSDYQIVGRRYYGPFTINELTVGQSTVLAFESATQLGGDIVVINNPAYSEATNINSSVNPYLSLFYHKDHLGNTRVITTSAGTILEQNDYYPFGLRTTRNQSYTTLNESLTSMAQGTGNIPSAPIYLYNTKEKQEFIHNTSSLINTQSSATYTSNYLDYGARFYNPVTARWNTQDPMAEKYQRFSPYNYCVNNPINFIDPKGEDLYLTGELAQMAFEQLQENVKKYLTLSMTNDGKITYTINEKVKKVRENAKRLVDIIDDNTINVKVSTTRSLDLDINNIKYMFNGGAFMGNSITSHPNETYQLVNPEFMGHGEDVGNLKTGTLLMHEITESYEGGKISQNKKKSARAKREIFNSEINETYEIYEMAHLRATQAPPIERKIFNLQGEEIKGNNLVGARTAVYYINSKPFAKYNLLYPRKLYYVKK